MKEVLLAFVFALLVGSWLNGNQQVNTLSGPQVEIQPDSSPTKDNPATEKGGTGESAELSGDQNKAHSGRSNSATSSTEPFEPIQPEAETVR